MPWLDVSSVLLDPMFADNTLTVTRNSQTVGNDGLATLAIVTTPFIGVVTSISGSVLNRVAEGEYITDTIMIHTKYRLTDGQLGLTADIINWGGVSWAVTNVNSYSTYGSGFISAVCTLKPLSGVAS